MFRGTQSRLYLLAHNAKAKARPNFGLPGVGYWTSSLYHKGADNGWVFVVVVFPMASFWIWGTSGILAAVDQWCGGGPQHITPKQMGVDFRKDKPWEFKFGIGEGFKNGEAKYKKAEGAIELH